MKRVFAVLTALVVAAVFAGCQSTPEDPVVIQKDMEQMIEKAQATASVSETSGNTLAQRLSVPERFIADESYSDGQLTLTADAEIVLPRVDTLPVVRVEPADFSQEMVDKLYDYLIGDTQMYQQQEIPTKEQIQENMVRCQEILSDPNSSEESKLQAEEHIAELEAAYPSASDSIDLVAANAKIGTQAKYHPGTGEKMSEFIGVNIAQSPGLNVFEGKNFYVKNNNKNGEIIVKENVGGWTVTDTASQGAKFRYTNYDLSIHNGLTVDAETVTPDRLNDRPERIADFTYQDALDTAQGFLSAAGIKDMQAIALTLKIVLPESYYTILYGDITPSEQEANEADIENGKYDSKAQDTHIQISFVRTLGGIPVTSDGSSSYIDDAMFGAQWFYETFTVEVCSQGICSVEWISPHRITETVTEDANILKFDKIAEVFDKMYRVTYDARGNSFAGEVTRVVLSLRRVMDQNNIGYGLFIPVWDFYGTMTVSSTDYPEEPSEEWMADEPLITINAIDGTVIDLDKGY